MHIELPYWLKMQSLEFFATHYKIDIAEAEKSLEEYKSIGDFFVRRLKRGARPLAMTEVVHPADSRLTALKKIENGKLEQIKGKNYSVNSLMADEDAGIYCEEGFFATYYLCPTDYHRVHAPVSGQIISVTYIPGDLWPVHDQSVANIENLFGVNERVVVRIKTFRGIVSVVFVGAMNVGKIELAFDQSISSNNEIDRSIRYIQYQSPKSIEKGSELGMFRMGSTVVVLYPKSYWELAQIESKTNLMGQKIKVNSAFF